MSAIALQPGRQSQTQSQKKKKRYFLGISLWPSQQPWEQGRNPAPSAQRGRGSVWWRDSPDLTAAAFTSRLQPPHRCFHCTVPRPCAHTGSLMISGQTCGSLFSPRGPRLVGPGTGRLPQMPPGPRASLLEPLNSILPQGSLLRGSGEHRGARA